MKIENHIKTEALSADKQSYSVPKQFDRNARLFGSEPLRKLNDSHVMIIGLGGVGSFATEAIARSGVGRLTLIDFDEVCITNVNRQLHAMSSTIGCSKAQLMAERARLINPQARVDHLHIFFDKSTAGEILAEKPDLIIDCIDNVTAKLYLLATCIFREIPVVTSLGASGRVDPSQVRYSELRKTKNDPLAKAIRKNLWQHHKINLKRVSNLIGVFSEEPLILPDPDYKSSLCGEECVCPNSLNTHHTCSKRNVIWGSAVFVTSTFGMVAASLAIRYLTGDKTISLKPVLKVLPDDDEPIIPV
ncbi:MAG: tRNA threonylcarbamoyladenosine dehydratase [Candidatus Riflebacteria bacterium]|nr:tRNA threonylcarbamoyladenosine dehydratase [Candidatus Riflebacteria bacterium]